MSSTNPFMLGPTKKSGGSGQSLKSARARFEVPTGSEDSFKGILSSLQSEARSVSGLKALGKEPKKAVKEGILSKLLGQEKGILSAPFRAVSAFIADVGGLNVADEDAAAALKQYNPLEAAYRSAKGEFAVTGGDIGWFKIREGDDFSTRLLKYAGALTYDVTLDPISWFGPQGLVGRKGMAAVISREGSNLLPAATKLLNEAGMESAQLVDKLVTTSVDYAAAKAGAPGAISKLGLVDGAITNEAGKIEVAQNALAGFVAENFYRNGKNETVRALSNLLGSEDVAKKLFQTLPEEARGGFFLKNPITGKPLAKIAGGTGAVIPGTEALVKVANEARFAIAANTPARFLSGHFNGHVGPTWSEVKKGLIGGVTLDGTKRTQLYTYVAYKDALRQARVDVADIGKEGAILLSSARGAKQALKTEDEKIAFDSAIRDSFHNPEVPIAADASEAAKAGAEMATSIADAMRLRNEAMREAGISVGDLGLNQRPTRYTPENIKRLEELGIDVGAEAYSIAQGRQSGIQLIGNKELAKTLGYELPNIPGSVALTAPSLNRYLDELEGPVFDKAGKQIKRFIEDPVEIAADYFASTNRALAQKRFSDSLVAAGIAYRIPPEVTKAIKDREMTAFLSAARNVSPAAQAKIKALRERADKQIQDLLDKAEVTAQTVGARYTAAETAATVARDAEETARMKLQEARRLVANTEPRARQIEQQLTDFARTGVTEQADLATREVRNASSRVSKAKNALEDTTAQIDQIANLDQTMGPEVAQAVAINTAETEAQRTARALSDPAVAQSMAVDAAKIKAMEAQDKLVLETLTSQEAQAARNQAEEFRKSVSSQLVGERLQAYQDFQTALELQFVSSRRLEDATKARRIAVQEAQAALEDTSIARATTLDAFIKDSIDKRIAWLQIRDELGAVKNMTDEEFIRYNGAKLASDEANKTLLKLVGYSSKKAGSEAAGRKFATEVLELTKRLTKDEYTNLTVLSNASRLNSFIDQLENVKYDTKMNVVGDMIASYRALRKNISETEIDNFAKSMSEALTGKKVGLTGTQKGALQRVKIKGTDAILETKTGVSKELQALYNDAGFAKIGSGPNKGNLRIPISMQDMYAAKGVRGVLEDMYKLHTDPSAWVKFITNLYDPLALIWKTGATAGRGPSFILNNMAGGTMNNYLGGVTVRDHLNSAKAVVEMLSVSREIRKLNPDMSYIQQVDLVEKELEKRLSKVLINGKPIAELFMEFLQRGGHLGTDTAWQLQEIGRLGLEKTEKIKKSGGGFTARYTGEAEINKAETAYRKVASFFLDNRVQNYMNEAAQRSEVWLRFAAFQHGWRKFGNLNSAMDFTYMLHFDYQDLSGAEVWLKRLVPFYTWSRNNIPLQFRATLLASDKMRKLYTANEELKAAFGVDGDTEWLNEYLPEYMQKTGGFLTYAKFGGNYLSVFNKLPITDVDKMFRVAYIGDIPLMVPRQSEIAGMIGPVGKTLTEFLTNRNYEYGYEYTSTSDLLLNQAQNIFPYYGTAKRLLSVGGLGAREKRISNLYNVLIGAGLGMSTFDEKQLRRGSMTNSIEVAAQFKKAAAEAGIDAEWLRDQLKKGRNLNQITNDILMGRGDLERVAREKAKKEKAKGPKKMTAGYMDVLQGLRNGQ
jgi:hypothetical protein